MKYVSIDIETSGLYPMRHDILQIGMVYEDTDEHIPLYELPSLEIFIEHPYIVFDPYTLKMHSETGLLDEYNEAEKTPVNEVASVVREWLFDLGYKENDDGEIEIIVAGKNYNAFDKEFLTCLPNWNFLKEHRRVLDPTMLYINWNIDEIPPSLDTCLKRQDPELAKIKQSVVAHDALQDAFDVVKLIRSESIFPSFLEEG